MNSTSWGSAAGAIAMEGLYNNDNTAVNGSHVSDGRSAVSSSLRKDVIHDQIAGVSSSRLDGTISAFECINNNEKVEEPDDSNNIDNDDVDGVESNSIGTWNSEKNDDDNDDNGEILAKEEVHLDDSDSDSDVVEVWSKPAAAIADPPPPSTRTQLPSSAAPTLGSIASSLSSAASASYQSRSNSMPSWMTSHSRMYHPHPTSYRASHWQSFSPDPVAIELPPNHVPTWKEILPFDFFINPTSLSTHHFEMSARPRRLTLSLINVWEFTIDAEPSYGIGNIRNDDSQSLAGLRTKIKQISKNHIGQNKRRGAVFERGAGNDGILPDDPLLKRAGNDGDVAPDGGTGKWRIPLGAYHALLTYLTQDRWTVVRGIPPEQLRAATLGRERFQKNVPSARELIQRGVHPGVAAALAPYQRAGVDFILEREGRALLADEMGLGKTVQAVAAMSAFWNEWPLLVLCPSSARYHWEVELRHWLGESFAATTDADSDTDAGPERGFRLKNEAINVLTSGKSWIFRTDGATKVVICSYGLIVSLVHSGRIYPGMFDAVIVDESHALKNKASKRTLAVLPLLKGAVRCLLLSGTPALARPSELWPQLSVLGGRRKDGREDSTSGIWIDEEGFYSKYVRGELVDDGGSKARLAELHTLLTSTVMIRRMKADILKNLQPKIREKAFIDIKDPTMQNEFRIYMHMLRQGGGVMGKFAREHSNLRATAGNGFHQSHYNTSGEEIRSREALHHLYKITGQSKVSKVIYMLKRWLADPTLGKLCIFAHHLDVLDAIGRGAGLNNRKGSTTKFIRIDGATLPKTRQEQILSFQTDPTVRVALLGITAAGVAVTLTASSTVWFAELFWTPAIMIQAEDRCHRIGQQARVRCLYFIARGTLDEILWKLIEKKFRDLGEFVEGKENMGIALERELEEDEDAEILKVDSGGDSKKRKAHDDDNDLFDLDDDGIKEEINELVHEEEDMLAMKNEEDEDDPDSEEKGTKPCHIPNKKESMQKSITGSSETSAICLLDEDEKEDKTLTIPEIRNLCPTFDALQKYVFDHPVRLHNIALYQMQFRGERYGFNMLHFKGRVVVKDPFTTGTKRGAIIVAIGRWVLRQEKFDHTQLRMKHEILNNSPVTLTFADDLEFMAWMTEDVFPNYQNTEPCQVAEPERQAPETIELLDDDDNDD